MLNDSDGIEAMTFFKLDESFFRNRLNWNFFVSSASKFWRQELSPKVKKSNGKSPACLKFNLENLTNLSLTSLKPKSMCPDFCKKYFETYYYRHFYIRTFSWAPTFPLSKRWYQEDGNGVSKRVARFPGISVRWHWSKKNFKMKNRDFFSAAAKICFLLFVRISSFWFLWSKNFCFANWRQRWSEVNLQLNPKLGYGWCLSAFFAIPPTYTA